MRTSGVTKIDENMTLFSDVTGQDCCPQGNRTLLERAGADYVPDRFEHEQSLLLREGDKTALFTGCAHRGVVNICARAKEIIGRDPDFVIGGMHLFSPSSAKASRMRIFARSPRGLRRRTAITTPATARGNMRSGCCVKRSGRASIFSPQAAWQNYKY